MKLCIIGVGRMGRRHIQVGRNAGFDVRGIYDVSDGAMQTALDEYDLPETVVFRSVEEMLAQVRPDAVAVASTASSHCEYVCASAAAGVQYILCEKPMAVSLAECDRMLDACTRSGSKLAVNHHMRFMEQYAVVKELAGSAAFGGLRSIIVSGGNFGLSMNGSHYFELLRFMAGDDIASASFWMDSDKVLNPRGPMYEDRSGQVRAVTQSGVRFYMEIGADQGHGIQLIFSCRLGQIFVDELGGFTRFVHREAASADLPTTRYAMTAVEETRTTAPANVIDPTVAVWRAMMEGHPFPDGHSGRQAIAALVAANVSGEQSGSSVVLGSSLPRDRIFPWA